MKHIMDSAMEQLFHKLVHKEIVNFEEFHMEILDMFRYIYQEQLAFLPPPPFSFPNQP